MAPGPGLDAGEEFDAWPASGPGPVFADFFRGCIDGDGTILVYTDRYNAVKKQDYVYERLYVSLVSASQPFLDWVRARVCALVGVDGDISERSSQSLRSLWRLRYAKANSIRLIGWMYYAPNPPCLARKRIKAERFLRPLGRSPLRPAGRPRAGWLYNETQPAGVA